jgi:TMEM175 potassium channel family protein
VISPPWRTTRTVSPDDEDLSHHSDTARLEAFSDGVFAIAITLLVLEIAVPHISRDQSLARSLGQEWPSFFGFGLSFITIGIMWINHHSMLKEIERVDHLLLVLNLLLLMGISFVPFPTAVLAEYLKESDHRLVATLLYGGTFCAIAVVWNAMWFYAAAGRRLIDRHVSDEVIRRRKVVNLYGPALYGIGIPLAFIDPWITLAIYVILDLSYLRPIGDYAL